MSIFVSHAARCDLTKLPRPELLPYFDLLAEQIVLGFEDVQVRLRYDPKRLDRQTATHDGVHLCYEVHDHEQWKARVRTYYVIWLKQRCRLDRLVNEWLRDGQEPLCLVRYPWVVHRS